MGLFGEKCPICGMKAQKNESLYSFGKYFCSTEHENQYMEEISKQRKNGKWPFSGPSRCC